MAYGLPHLLIGFKTLDNENHSRHFGRTSLVIHPWGKLSVKSKRCHRHC